MRTSLDSRRRSGLRSRVPLVSCLVASVFLTALPVRAQDPDPRYWRLAQVQAAFNAWSAAYPDIFYQTSLGQSSHGVPILMARISDHASVREPEPAVLFQAAQHSNECNGTGAIMRQMAALLQGYGVDSTITARVDNLEQWFVPMLNPDGHGYVFSGAGHWSDWRKTLRDNNQNGQPDYPYDGVDLNRNWDWYWNECDNTQPDDLYYKGPWVLSENEAAAMRSLVLKERPVVVIDYHSPVTIGFVNTIFYPWLSTHGWGQSPDYAVARSVAQGWAAATRDEENHTYHTIFGYDTLPKEQNWVYGRCGILSFEMEISDRCWWEGVIVDTIAARVARGSNYVVDRVRRGPGIRGTVTDRLTGQPLQAEVQIVELHSPQVGPRTCDGRFGQFYRLTLPGDYTVIVGFRDYEADTCSVTVDTSAWTTIDVALQRSAADVESELRETGEPELHVVNPVPAGQAVRLTVPGNLDPAQVELFSLQGRCEGILGRDLEPGRSHDLRLPGGLPAGIYIVRLRAGHRERVVRLVCVD